jgi:hypothetical protein
MRKLIFNLLCLVFLLWWSAPDATAMASKELLVNGSLDMNGTNEAPAGWSSWNDGAHSPDTGTARSPTNSWALWSDGGIYQDVLLDIYPGEVIKAGGYLLTPGADALRGGGKRGTIELEFYTGNTLVTNCPASPAIDSNSPPDTWVYASVSAVMPSNATKVRVTVRCSNSASGDGRFLADDVSVTNQTCVQNLLGNGTLDFVSGTAPVGWYSWNSAIGPENTTYLTGPNAWTTWDEGGIFQDVTSGFEVGDRLEFGYWALQPSSDPFVGIGPASQMRLIFYNAQGGTIEVNWAMPYLMATNAGSSWSFRTNLDEWVFSHNISRVPADTTRVRIEIRQHSFEYGSGRFIADNAFLANLCHESNLLVNPLLNGAGAAPDGWSQWNEGSHDQDTNTWRSGFNSWSIWWDGGIYQDVRDRCEPGYPVTFSAYLLTPASDALRNGSKCGTVNLEFYAGNQLLSTASASNSINQDSTRNSWILCEGGALAPFGTTSARLVIRCDNASSGDGRFYVDDPVLRAIGPAYKNFGASAMMSYGGFGDHGPPPHDSNWSNFTVMDTGIHTTGDGAMIHLWGCNWKWMDANVGATQQYQVTPDTLLEFDFMSDGAQGEVNGVGLAGHTNIDVFVFGPEVFFQIYGTETYSNQTFHNYPGSGWKHYEIPVGQYTTNRLYAIVFANEADGGQNTSVYYRNMRLVENYWARAAVRDSDLDGSSDWQEGIAGTDPQSPSSRLDAHVGQNTAQNQVVQWPSASNRTYTIYRSVDSMTNFTQRAAGVVATPPNNSYTDTVSGLSRVYYRVRAKK